MKKQTARMLTIAVAVSLAVALAAPQQGPVKDPSDTVARPRNRGDQPTSPPPDQQKLPSKFPKQKEDLPEGVPTYRADSINVTVDVAVLDNKGHFIPNIPKQAFRVLEDEVPQQVSNFSKGEAPMTVCMVIEFSNLFQGFYSYGWYQTLTASYGFLETLRQEDYVAVVAYDMRSEILSDFSTDKRKAQEAMARLRIAGFSESNLYDALVDTSNRMQTIEGRKAIVLIASGIDTFSKLTFDKTRKALQNDGVPIYAIGMLQTMREMMDSRGMLGPIARLDFLQADNQMRTFATETGGFAWFPRFIGEFPRIFSEISDSLRNQYSLGYSPTNQARDGKFRKIKVQLVNPATNEPLKVVDDRTGKPIKYKIVAKMGYTAPREVE